MYWQATKWCKRNDYCDFIYRFCLSYFFVYWSVCFLNTNSLAGLHQNWGSTYTRKFEKQQVFGFKMGGRLKHNRLNIRIEVNQKLRNFGSSPGCLLALTGCFWHPQRRLRHNTAFTAPPPPPSPGEEIQTFLILCFGLLQLNIGNTGLFWVCRVTWSYE